MPIIIPAPPAAGVVPAATLFDFVYDSAGQPRANVPVLLTIERPAEDLISNPPVEISSVRQQTTTDTNGRWTFTIVVGFTYVVWIDSFPAFRVLATATGSFQAATIPATD